MRVGCSASGGELFQKEQSSRRTRDTVSDLTSWRDRGLKDLDVYMYIYSFCWTPAGPGALSTLPEEKARQVKGGQEEESRIKEGGNVKRAPLRSLLFVFKSFPSIHVFVLALMPQWHACYSA